MPRQPKGRPTIYKGADGLYHCMLPVGGTNPDGTPKRRHIKRDSAAGVAAEVDAVLARLKQGHGKLAKIGTLADWLHHWVHVILLARRDAGGMSHNTWDDYESICRVHLIPNLGQWRISGAKRRLEPEHVEALWAQLVARGLAPSYVARMHVTLHQALKMAFKRGRADRNVMEMVDRPTFRKKKIKSPPYQDACKLVGEALRDERAHRWLLGMLAGPRQGEVLGIRWPRVHLDPDPPKVPFVDMAQQIQRRKWRHGCPDPVVCNKTRTRKDETWNPCNRKMCGKLYGHGCGDVCGKKIARYCPERRILGECFRHITKDGKPKPCPAPCAPDCTEHASTCPKRVGGGLVETDLKTHASEEPMALGGVVTELLRQERERQIREGIFDPDGYVVQGSRPGKPMDPRRDYDLWCALEKRAGVSHTRLHAGTRHLTGSMLSATGADLPMIRDILRQADTAVAAGYVDVGLSARQDALDRVAKALIDGDISMILGAKKVA